MTTLAQLKTAILTDGRIDASEVTKLQELVLADGRIDRNEAETLFSLSDACPEGNDDAWPIFFADAIISHVLNDADSPRMVDADESEWLRKRIMGDGKVCEAERQLMRRLKVAAKDLPADLVAFIEANT
jgi:hypothetical protein